MISNITLNGVQRSPSRNLYRRLSAPRYNLSPTMSDPSSQPSAPVPASLFSDGRLRAPRQLFPVALRFERVWTQFTFAFAIFISISLLNLGLEKWIGHQAVAFVYLLAVVWLALFVDRAAILFGSALTALGWSFLFAPPKYSFRIA